MGGSDAGPGSGIFPGRPSPTPFATGPGGWSIAGGWKGTGSDGDDAEACGPAAPEGCMGDGAA